MKHVLILMMVDTPSSISFPIGDGVFNIPVAGNVQFICKPLPPAITAFRHISDTVVINNTLPPEVWMADVQRFVGTDEVIPECEDTSDVVH